MDLQRKAIFAEAERVDDLISRSFVGLFRASRKIDERLAAYGQYDFLHDAFAGVDQRHIGEAGISYQPSTGHPIVCDSMPGLDTCTKPHRTVTSIR